jgi:hypothetical protein
MRLVTAAHKPPLARIIFRCYTDFWRLHLRWRHKRAKTPRKPNEPKTSFDFKELSFRPAETNPSGAGSGQAYSPCTTLFELPLSRERDRIRHVALLVESDTGPHRRRCPVLSGNVRGEREASVRRVLNTPAPFARSRCRCSIDGHHH